MRIDNTAMQMAVSSLHASEAHAADVMSSVASGNLGAAGAVGPANLDVAINVSILGKVMDVNESIAMELINMISTVDVKI